EPGGDGSTDQVGWLHHPVGRRRVAVRVSDAHLQEGAWPLPGPKTARAKLRTSNGARSVAPSPTPIILVGTPSSASIATTAPPLAVPSILVSTRPLISNALLKPRAWARLAWPRLPSSTSSDSWGAPGSALAATRPTLASSLSRLLCVCRRPAV